MKSVTFSVLISFLVLPSDASDVFAAETSTAVIVPVERWSNVFGGQEVRLHFRVVTRKAELAVEGRIQWHHSANQRTLARGEAETGRGDAAQTEVILRLPEVRDGVIFQTQLTMAYVPRGENSAAATLTKTLWLFPEDPFAGQREALEDRQLALFDPDGRTAELFAKNELSHRRIRSAAVLEDGDEHSYVIVGEGTSLIRNRGLADRLLSFAAAGGTVLMLAPSEGVIPMPGEALKQGDRDSQPGELRFRQHHVIREFDKRLDSEFLPGPGDFAGSKISLRTRLNRIGMDVSKGGNWPWFTIEYPETKGRFVFCGFGIVKNWNNGPAPRYLLNRILIPRSKR